MCEVNESATGIVFLSGGSALQALAGYLAGRGIEASHVISVFDTGGSAGRLRDVCTDIAIGDIRKRLTAIGDRKTPTSRPLVDLFASRLPRDEPLSAVRRQVEKAAQGEGELLEGLHNGTLVEVAESFARLLDTVPVSFDWCDGSVGNLVLTGRYLHEGDWASALGWAHRRLSACGSVFPVSTARADLGAKLANGRHVVGQARITSQSEPIEAPIEHLSLRDHDGEARNVEPDGGALDELRRARAVVYSWGSFYTSVLPALLVDEVGATIRARAVPKVLLLNPVRDSETQGKKPADLVREIHRYAGERERANGNGHPTHPPVTHVIALRLPNGESFYRASDRAEIEALGPEVIEIDSPGLPGEVELSHVAGHLLSLAAN
jgi:2-phospho-L-lactate transferase/gluconeogenesis factor (CofD/UPF0052 family)